MARRIRSIKPEWLEDEQLCTCSDSARMLSVALITMSDDYGNGRANEMFLAAQVWPYSRDPHETLARLSSSLRELAAIGFVRLYSVAGQQYFAIRNWGKHQKVQHPSKPLIPGPELCTHEDVAKPSGDSHETLTPDLEGKGRERMGETSPDPLPVFETTKSALKRGYVRRYEQKIGSMWMEAGKHDSKIIECARWCMATADDLGITAEQVAFALLEEFFADQRAESKAFPWGFIASNPSEYLLRDRSIQSILETRKATS